MDDKIVTMTVEQLRGLLMQAWDDGADWTVDAMREYGENYSPTTENNAQSKYVESVIAQIL